MFLDLTKDPNLGDLRIFMNYAMKNNSKTGIAFYSVEYIANRRDKSSC